MDKDNVKEDIFGEKQKEKIDRDKSALYHRIGKNSMPMMLTFFRDV
jgi:hypothetical protein